MRRWSFMLLGLLLLLPATSNHELLSRKKRYLVFPANSFLTLSACLAKGGIILSPPAFVFTFDWDLLFQLPSNTSLLQQLLPAYHVNRRDRRDLYSGMEALLERQGLNGRACVLRSLCEAQRNLDPSSGELMEQIFHAMFTLPADEGGIDEFPWELQDHEMAHNHGRIKRDCAALYSECPYSLLDLALW